MLSRLVLAPRVGIASLARQAAAPSLRTRAAIAVPSALLARPYSQKNDKSAASQANEGAKKSPAASEEAPSSHQPTEASSEQQPQPKDASAEAADSSTDSAKEPEQIPFHKLPDLTQGIPSTFAQEMAEKAGQKPASYLQTIEQEESSTSRQRRDPYDSYESTHQLNRRKYTRFAMALAAIGGAATLVYMGRNWEDSIDAERHPDAPNGWGVGLWWNRVKARTTESITYYQEPAFDKLLPDPEPLFARPYTLCLSLDELLVHSEWSREYGWRVAKRPGLDYFLLYLSQYYELVLFTTASSVMAENVLQKLDPYHIIIWKLYREATKFEDGEIVKDLSYLNRDLSKVIMIDTDAKLVRKQPENAIILPPWKGNSSDRGLINMIPFLEYIHTMEYDDVRRVIKSFEGTDIPTEFAHREAVMRREFEKRNPSARKPKVSGFGAIGNMLGLKSSNMSMAMQAEGEQSASEAFAQGKMLQDIARERGQRNYEFMAKNIKENGEKWVQEEKEAMEKAQQEAMNNMMGSFGGWFGVAKPADAPAATSEANK
ncbi:import inner membrane translocase subunit tim-50 [Cordyceps fumosorosea ARSEF 2679]|uniref:Mitochondrial import inner membrane translocase subunit TIM50 n=1 Tax=Cordyceps fumosorosea (strain ARSEF 2679) TaxID=1081104 RepID=A0A168ASW9_CORFA|nr:import inner membrane translocase subunit tim-50 [Cordyceps fumosorosea ARSEF 2679]OAA69150.1 import inner membrane translocase subunit tim-50 [Cordyceps fumosorosea ARSEF 2679]